MKKTTLPRRLADLPILGYRKDGRPIRLIAGGAPEGEGGDGGNSGGAGAGGTGGDDKPPAGGTFTQADLDRIVGERVSRERTKFADYDDLKRKAGEYDKTVEAQKTAEQKLADERDQLAAENAQLKVGQMRRDAAEAAGLPGSDAQFLTATDADGLKAQAEALAARVKASSGSAGGGNDQGYRPPGGSGTSVAAGRELYAARRGATKTT